MIFPKLLRCAFWIYIEAKRNDDFLKVEWSEKWMAGFLPGDIRYARKWCKIFSCLKDDVIRLQWPPLFFTSLEGIPEKINPSKRKTTIRGNFIPIRKQIGKSFRPLIWWIISLSNDRRNAEYVPRNINESVSTLKIKFPCDQRMQICWFSKVFPILDHKVEKYIRMCISCDVNVFNFLNHIETHTIGFG